MNQSIIYKIVCKDPSIADCYVGRTASYVARVNQHRTCCTNQNSNNYKYRLYQKIRENGGWDNWEIKPIETVDKTSAGEREAFWFHELKATLNNNIPNQSHKESHKIWIKNNPTYLHDYSVDYYAKNKEAIQERQKVYYSENKEKMNAISKAWFENNRERNRKYQMDRYYKIKAEKLAMK